MSVMAFVLNIVCYKSVLQSYLPKVYINIVYTKV